MSKGIATGHRGYCSPEVTNTPGTAMVPSLNLIWTCFESDMDLILLVVFSFTPVIYNVVYLFS